VEFLEDRRKKTKRAEGKNLSFLKTILIAD